MKARARWQAGLAVAVVGVGVLLGGLSQTLSVAGAQAEPPSPEAREFFAKAQGLNRGQPTCPESVLRQKEFFYRKAVEASPSYTEAWNNLGDVYENLGQYEQALEAYGKAAALSPDLAAPLFGIADVHFRCGRWQEAVEYYDRGLRLEPGDQLSSARRDLAIAALSGKAREEPSQVVPAEEIVRALTPFVKRGLDGIVNASSISFGESRIPFRTDSAEILPQARRQLDELAKALRSEALASAFLEVAGHTDERGAADYNTRLSLRRAKAVKAYLTRIGVAAQRLREVGHGEARPVAFGHDPASWAANRRVEITRLDRDDAIAAEAPRRLALDFAVLQSDGPGKWRVVESGKSVLRSGDSYRILVRPHESCHVYLYQVDAYSDANRSPNPIQSARGIRLKVRGDSDRIRSLRQGWERS